MISLSCNTSGVGGDRCCLAAEGFGNRMCFLESLAAKHLPFNMSVCVFTLEQALSVRALQEMVSAKCSEDTVRRRGQGLIGQINRSLDLKDHP